jgi:hypothetical protein
VLLEELFLGFVEEFEDHEGILVAVSFAHYQLLVLVNHV